MRHDGERVFLTTEEALGVLNWHDDNGCAAVHTFRAGGFAIIGCDWPRASVEAWLAAHEVELTGPMARGMGHGIGGLDDLGPLMLATDESRLAALEAQEVAP